MAKHEHDCKSCLYLGSIGSGDLYYCALGTIGSYVLRYSSEPSDYSSVMDINDKAYADTDNQYHTGARAANERDLMLRRLTALNLLRLSLLNLISAE